MAEVIFRCRRRQHFVIYEKDDNRMKDQKSNVEKEVSSKCSIAIVNTVYITILIGIFEMCFGREF